MRQLRNHTSHPKEQFIYDPNMTLEMLRVSAELISALFLHEPVAM